MLEDPGVKPVSLARKLAAVFQCAAVADVRRARD
jgi:hypothetical protein